METAFKRKPLPGPPSGPPPPPDFDPFPQRQRPLRAARSTPNIRQSVATSIYDPPPAYEEFPGVDANGRLAFAAPVSDFGPGRVPSPGPATPAPHFSPSVSPVAGGKDSPAPSIPGPSFPGPSTAQTFPPWIFRPWSSHNSRDVSTGTSTPFITQLHPIRNLIKESQLKEKTFWQTALDETKYFAGGLISHPFEYTKHYSILRHSGALVWYRGPSTSITITIFSDAPLPATRTVWLQQKGFSGNMGMNLKSLVGANTSWLDVTPSMQGTPAAMTEGDERGCQRDLKKFLKKAPKNLAKHMPRETHVVRIPAAADDGYFRLVLCTGGGGDGGKRKVLCPSPVFRVASTSTDMSVTRGASFASMPLELGIKAGSVVATTVVNRYIGPAAAVVQSRTKKISQAKFVTKHAAHIAYAKSGIEKSGIKTHVTAYEEQYASTRSGGYDAWQSGEAGFQEAPPEVIGPDSGPTDPFPIKFDGKIVRGTGRGGMELGIPTANLEGIPEDVRMRMRGVYFGWARVVPRSGLEAISTDWHESIITVGPAPYATPRVAAKNVATVHLIHEFGGALFLDTKLKVLVMGQLRMAAPPVAGSEAALEAYGADVLLTVASLSRDSWCPIETRERMRTMRSEMSLADRYVETRDRVQKQVDRMPVHLAGVPTIPFRSPVSRRPSRSGGQVKLAGGGRVTGPTFNTPIAYSTTGSEFNSQRERQEM
ncbi:uncharacterized protein CLUP02_04349 [Colletotrichum lupini]|uniref:Riboflavin kinase n=1 Tax=Colletotrichum lupini TaxID=145971 RepID=A0A9Q8SKK9_9PEZI|nr:uncharacterized protein CLUP02_04349 [Colletotrichum lupini]UQC78870.1 hypothetical protein CLUP02_04349 [Colletotrichum lupini]